MSKKNYTWYIEPLDGGHTNEVLSRELPDTNFLRDKICADGEKRNLWQCDYKFVSKMINGQESLKVKFAILVQEGDGKIRLWNLYK